MVAVAIGGAAVLGAGASIISGSNAADATESAAAQNNATQTAIYNQNKETLAPFVNQGGAATKQINGLLGLDTGQDTAATSPAYSYGGVNYYSDGNGGYTNTAPAAASSSTPSYDQAFANFQNSDGYKFRVSEGEKALQASLGSKGYLDSGAATKAALTFGQNTASGEFENYLSALTGQQGVGLTAASAQAGVGQNYANATSANNTAAGNAAANAALATGSAVNSALGNGLSAYTFSQGLKSSYGGGNSADAFLQQSLG